MGYKDEMSDFIDTNNLYQKSCWKGYFSPLGLFGMPVKPFTVEGALKMSSRSVQRFDTVYFKME